jgi:integrase
MKARKTLTDKIIRAAKPHDNPYRLYDSEQPRLHVRIQPSGTKIFNIIRKGSHRDERVGTFPEMTLAAARIAAEQRHPSLPKPKAAIAPMTFDKFLTDHYEPMALRDQKAGKATVKALKHVFVPLIGKKHLTKISELDVQAFKNKRAEEGRKPSTINRDLDRIRGALNFAVKLELMERNPFSNVTRPTIGDKPPRYLETGEETALREALHNFPVIEAPTLLALNTGMRRGEIIGLDWADVQLDRRHLTVRWEIAKSKRSRVIPLTDEAMALLKAMEDRTGLVFPELTEDRWRKAWKPLLKKAKIKKFRIHDCRHHFASKLVMLGAPLYDVQSLLGHSNPKQTQTYAHLAPSHLAATVAKLMLVKK